MPPLTSQKMEGFCLSIMEGLSASDAYREHYNCGKMKTPTINRNAKALIDNNKIATRLEELRAPIRERAGLTLESHLSRLEALSLAAEQEAQFGAAITAETNRGKASGLYVEKVEQSGPGGGPIENKWTVEVVSAKKD